MTTKKNSGELANEKKRSPRQKALTLAEASGLQQKMIARVGSDTLAGKVMSYVSKILAPASTDEAALALMGLMAEVTAERVKGERTYALYCASLMCVLYVSALAGDIWDLNG